MRGNQLAVLCLACCVQVERVSWHPSVGIWAGNNEIEGSFNWYAESRSNKQLFAGDYNTLFVDTIRRIIREVSSGVALCRRPVWCMLSHSCFSCLLCDLKYR